MLKFSRLEPIARTGDEAFLNAGGSTDITLREFWRWAVSDLVENTTRARLAEFIVAKALGIPTEVRDSWAPCDLKTPAGLRLQPGTLHPSRTARQSVLQPLT